jgi:hypothetical protein
MVFVLCDLEVYLVVHVNKQMQYGIGKSMDSNILSR